MIFASDKQDAMSTNLANRKPEQVAEGDSERRHEAESDKSTGNGEGDSAGQDGGDQEKQESGPSSYVCHAFNETI